MTENKVSVFKKKIVYTKRKTVGLHINDNAELIIKAPYGMDEKTINDIIRKHLKWIEKTKKRIEQKNNFLKSISFKSGSKFLLLGKYYILNIKSNTKNSNIKNTDIKYSNIKNSNIINHKELIKTKSKKMLNLIFKICSGEKTYIINVINTDEQNFINIYCDLNNRESLQEETIREILQLFYKEFAAKIFISRVNYFKNRYNFKFNKFKISNAKTKWGSCSYKNNINIVWRLVMAPIEVIDYVIVHELIHLKHRHHQKSFWKDVQKIIPDYKDRIKWLKENGYLLEF